MFYLKQLLVTFLVLSLLVGSMSCVFNKQDNNSQNSNENGDISADTTPPFIFDVAVSNITDTTATIIWSTDEPATSQTEYGETSDYGSGAGLNYTLVTTHSVSLDELEPDTTYHFRVTSDDTNGNRAISEDNIFTTLPDTTSPIISDVRISSINESNATVTWDTDESATSHVEYGETSAYGTVIALNEDLVISHSVNLSGLEPNTTYHIKVKSKDASGNEAVSADYTFSTTKPTEQVSGLISDDITWTSEYTYIATGDIAVEQGTTLTIEPGTVVKFDGLYYLKVMGTLKAIGHPDNRIKFTSSKTSTNPGDWLYIHFAPESTDASLDMDNNYLDGSTIQFATIDYGGDPVINIDGASPLIYECIVENNGASNESFVVSANGSINIDSDDAWDYARPIIENCTFRNNNLQHDGLAIKTELLASPTISHNTIYGSVYSWASEGAIEYNRIVSEGDAITIDVSVLGDSPTLKYNTIEGCIVINTSDTVTEGTFSYNNFYKGNSQYIIRNEPGIGGTATIYATNNWWGTTDNTEIDQLIYDFYDDFNLGKVVYAPTAVEPVDTTAPVVSQVEISNVTDSSITITWTTDEVATSQVEYGNTIYTTHSVLDSSLVTIHNVTLSGLNPNTTYHYRVKSVDEFGNEGVSVDHIFTTLNAIAEPPESTDSILCSFAWEYAGLEWTWDIPISTSLYEYYSERARTPTDDYSVYVTDPLDDSFIDEMVAEFEEAAQEEGYSDFETVNFTVAFVQSLPYTSDAVTTSYDEYPRYPIETLVDNGGDCEDTSILMAAILKAMGYGVILINPPGHMAVGVLGGEVIYGTYWEHDGEKYFYLETTGSGWEIGEIPSEYEGESAYLYDIVPIPILTHDWDADRYTSYIEVSVTVENVGTASADEVYVFAGLDAGDDMLWNPQQSGTFNLQAGHSQSIILTIIIPEGKHTRLVVQIVDDGYAVDTSYSVWFDT